MFNRFLIKTILGLVDDSIKNPDSQRKYDDLLIELRDRLNALYPAKKAEKK